MGLTTVNVKIRNPADPKKGRDLDLLVDTGAIYSIVPAEFLKGLDIRPLGKRSFTLADGGKVEREVGGALYKIGKHEGYASVVFGSKKDKPLLGVTALEEMGLQVDPVTKQLRRTELLLL